MLDSTKNVSAYGKTCSMQLTFEREIVTKTHEDAGHRRSLLLATFCSLPSVAKQRRDIGKQL